MSITDIGREAAEESGTGQAVDPEDYDRFDVAGVDFLKTHPTTAASGQNARVLRYFAGNPDSEQKYEGLDRGYNGLVVDDPFVVNDDELTASVIVENDGGTGDDFKLVDLADRQTDVLTPTGPGDFFDSDEEARPEWDFTAINGVDFAGNSTYGDVRAYISEETAQMMIEEAQGVLESVSVGELSSPAPVQIATLRANGIETMEDLADEDAEAIAEMGDFGVETLIIKLTGSAGQRATRCLDVHGGEAADVTRTDDNMPAIDEDSGYPSYNGGLIEYVDDFIDNDQDDYVPPRFARDSELRPDVEGQTVSFLLQRRDEVVSSYDGNAYFATVLSRSDASDAWKEVTPTTEFQPSELTVAATRWLEYAYPTDEEIVESRNEQGVSVDDDLSESVDVTTSAEASTSD